MAYEILVPQPGIKAGPSAVRAQSPNHQATGGVPTWLSRCRGYRKALGHRADINMCSVVRLPFVKSLSSPLSKELDYFALGSTSFQLRLSSSSEDSRPETGAPGPPPSPAGDAQGPSLYLSFLQSLSLQECF